MNIFGFSTTTFIIPAFFQQIIKKCTSQKADRSEGGPIENALVRSIDVRNKGLRNSKFLKGKQKQSVGISSEKYDFSPSIKKCLLRNQFRWKNLKWTQNKLHFFPRVWTGLKQNQKKILRKAINAFMTAIVLYRKPPAYSNKWWNFTITSLVCWLCLLLTVFFSIQTHIWPLWFIALWLNARNKANLCHKKISALFLWEWHS